MGSFPERYNDPMILLFDEYLQYKKTSALFTSSETLPRNRPTFRRKLQGGTKLVKNLEIF